MSDVKPPARLSEAELAQLAIDVVEGRVYATNTEEGLRAFIVVLAFVDLTPIVDKIGAVYETLEKALPRSLNGLPMFTSFKLLHVDDLEPLRVKVEEYEQLRAGFVS